MKVVLTQDWKEVDRILGSAAPRFKAAAERAVLLEAHLLRGHMTTNIATGGGHAGKPFAPLSETTLIVRRFRGFGGGKPLIVSGALRASISVQKKGGGIFVGVKRSSKGGVKVAELHEFGGGPWTKPMTARQRRFLAAAFRAAGKPFGTGGAGGGVIRWKIPARPFIGPVIERFGKHEDIRKRFFHNVAKDMGGDLGSA